MASGTADITMTDRDVAVVPSAFYDRLEEKTEDMKMSLGDRDPEEFIQLPDETRFDYYRRHLIVNGYAACSEDHDTGKFPHTLEGCLLRWHCFPPGGAAAEVAEEAQRFYYSENKFILSTFSLSEFPDDLLRSQKDMRPMIRDVTVQVDMTVDEGSSTWEESEDIEELQVFENATSVTVMLVGKTGCVAGFDLRSQLMIRKLAKFVDDLIRKFGDGFKIVKTPGSYVHEPAFDITSYWDEPSERTKQLFKDGFAVGEDLMQMQVQQWVKEARQKELEQQTAGVGAE